MAHDRTDAQFGFDATGRAGSAIANAEGWCEQAATGGLLVVLWSVRLRQRLRIRMRMRMRMRVRVRVRLRVRVR